MGFDWTHIENSFPTFREGEPPQESSRKIHEYLYLLMKQLMFTLQNLDTGNWNAVALKNFAADTTKDLAEATRRQEEALTKLAQGQITTNEDMGDRIKATQEEVSHLQAGADTTWGAIEGLRDDVSDNRSDIESLADELDTVELLRQEIEAVRELAERISQAVQAGTESTVIGEQNKPLYLVGQIYINGELYSGGEGT